VRLIAFYLPQYHPIPENDRWWGPGFTEWRNVARGRPLFRGHEQPHEPGELGYYDLRVPETRIAQAELARAHGISGFCYYHYWFSGKRLLERPFDDVLASGRPDFPFCLCWANESWSRRWLGEEKQILIKQEYSSEDDRRHAQWLVRAFSDPRYIRLGGRPLLLVYRPGDLPDPRGFCLSVRQQCRSAGLPEPYLVGTDAHRAGMDCQPLGFDATLSFQPKLGLLPGALSDQAHALRMLRNLRHGHVGWSLRIYSERDARRRMSSADRRSPHGVRYPCVYVRWDNTPRRGADGIVIHDDDEVRFESALADAQKQVQQAAAANPASHDLLFINAWNEWAEGNHLEPDLRHGHAFLDAVQRVAREP